MRWVGHVACMADEKYKIVGKPAGKRQLGDLGIDE
jgi:hypothetical protein